MRVIVAILALLAAGKVGYHEYIYRAASSEIIIAAYRERAVKACREQSARAGDANASASVDPWNHPENIRLTIGNPAVDVALWSTDSTLWNARYKNPYLLLSGSDQTRNLMCEFDVVHDVASVKGL